jgi:hypothetical protein
MRRQADVLPSKSADKNTVLQSVWSWKARLFGEELDQV